MEQSTFAAIVSLHRIERDVITISMKMLLVGCFFLAVVIGRASELPASLPQIEFLGATRACAGAVADETHTIHLKVRVKHGALPLRGEPITFDFEHNRAHVYGDGRPPKTAQFSNGKGFQSSLTAITDEQGEIELAVLSSDVVCRPRLVARWKKQVIGGVECVFGRTTKYRRFPDPWASESGPVKEDSGLLFYETTRGGREISKGKVYLKFKIDAQRGNVKGNWRAVNGHRLRIYVASVEERTTSATRLITDASEIAQFASVFSPGDAHAHSCLVTTAHDGSATFELRNGPRRRDARGISVAVDDVTQWDDDEDNYAPLLSHPQRLPLAALNTQMPQWFTAPEGLSGRLLYTQRKSEKEAFGTRYYWHFFGSSISNTDEVALDLSATIHSGTGPNGGVSDCGNQPVYVPIFGAPHLSPDGRLATFEKDRPSQDIDGCHDLWLANFASGQIRPLVDYLFSAGSPAFWSPGGDRLAYVRGSTEVLGSSELDPPERLCVYDIKNGREVEIAQGGSHISKPAWASDGGLYFSQWSATLRPSKEIPNAQKVEYGVNLNYLPPQSTSPRPLLHDALVPLPSPDGKLLAFYGREEWQKPRLTDRYALSVMRSEGKERRVLDVEDSALSEWSLASNAWLPDNRHIVNWSTWPDKETPKAVMVREWDISDGTLRNVALLALPQIPTATPQNYEGQRIEPLHVSNDGKYWLFCHDVYRDDHHTVGVRIGMRTLYALRLSDGKALPLAILSGVFDWHDTSHATA